MKFYLQGQLTFTSAILIFLATVALTQTPPSVVATPQSDSKAATGKRGAITGRVLGEDGQPLAGVSVEVFQVNATRNDRHTITTDNDGSFEVNNLPAGTYSVIATVPGFVNAPSSATEGLLGSSQPRYRIGDNATITMIKGGAITGKVLDSTGQPQVGAPVWAIRLGDAEGRAINEAVFAGRPGMSDDRGVYRLYGLPSGSYIVYTNGAGELISSLNGTREVPTYYPNGTRDTAQKVSVSPGMEVAAIDIRHRGDWGHAVSGTIVGTADNSATAMSVYVELLQIATGTRLATTGVNLRTGNGFGVYGVPDGEYEIMALQRISPTSGASTLVSTPRRVSVRGGDVTGLELRLMALGSIAGRVVLEKIAKADCNIVRRGQLEEILLLPRHEDQPVRRGALSSLLKDTIPDEKGEFVIRDMEPGRYRLNLQLPSDHWYVKAMSLAGATPTKPAATKAPITSLATTGITLKGGEKLSGVTISLAEGAASLSGYLEGKKPAARMRMHLVPAEKDAADEVLRYAEVVTRDGVFTFSHLAPGKYWVIPRVVPEDESEEKPANFVAWDAIARTKLRMEAEAANKTVELMPCQRLKEVILQTGALVK